MNEDVFQKAVALIPQIREEILRQVPFELQGMIGLEMNRTAITVVDKKPVIDKTKNTTNILNVRTGRLFRSFTKGQKENITKKTHSGLEYGSLVPYAAIHEYGGVIDHPGTKNGFGRKIEIAAHDIRIPKRAYLKPAVTEYEKDGGELEDTINRALQPLKNLFA